MSFCREQLGMFLIFFNLFPVSEAENILILNASITAIIQLHQQ